MVSWVAALLTGIFGLGGVVGGALLTTSSTRRVEKEKREAGDERRWLEDRRAVYAKYLTLTESMLREIDVVALELQYSPVASPITDIERESIRDGLVAFMGRWDEVLQPTLEELMLIAAPDVSDLADRMSGALLELTGEIESMGYFVEHYPTWFQAKDMLSVLRNAMRQEIGNAKLSDAGPYVRAKDWPWLADRPPRESYRQGHPGEPARSGDVAGESSDGQ